MEALVVVHWFVGRAGIVRVSRGRELGWDVPEKRGGSPAFLESGGVGERLDRRTGLSGTNGHIHLTIDLLIPKIGRANHGQDLPSGGVQDDH